jgi:integrase
MPRSIATRKVFHVDGRPIGWTDVRREACQPALASQSSISARRTTCATATRFHNLQAGVPIATFARQMGHSDVSRTFTVYGGWVREMGADAAAMRAAWILADCTNMAPGVVKAP